MELLMPMGNARLWKEAATIVLEGIGSRLLSREVSESYFALLHLLVEVCGTRALPQYESSVTIWLTTTGLPIFEAAAGDDVNDAVAELLQRSKWYSTKLTLVNYMLMTRFDQSELSKAVRTEALVEPLGKSRAGDRLVQVYFGLKAQSGLKAGAVSKEETTKHFDNETLVILVASAWQSAMALRHELPALWEHLMASGDAILAGFSSFETKIDKLSRLRGTQGQTQERVAMYMALLKALMNSLEDRESKKARVH